MTEAEFWQEPCLRSGYGGVSIPADPPSTETVVRGGRVDLGGSRGVGGWLKMWGEIVLDGARGCR